jgi:hypothetical protein
MACDKYTGTYRCSHIDCVRNTQMQGEVRKVKRNTIIVYIKCVVNRTEQDRKHDEFMHY